MGSRSQRWDVGVDVFDGGVLDLVSVAPWCPFVDEFGLVEADHRFGEGVDAPMVKSWVQGAGARCCRVRWSVMTRWWTSRARNRLRQRMMSFLVRPSVVRRAT